MHIGRVQIVPVWLTLAALTLAALPAAVHAGGKVRLYMYELPDNSRVISNYPINSVRYRLIHTGASLARLASIEHSRYPQLVRLAPSAAAGVIATAKPYDHMIQRIAAEHQVDPVLVKAIMHVESAFNPHARSRKGAVGLMQLMPETARRYGVNRNNIYDPYHNIQAGVQYLKDLSMQFRDVRLVIAAYNAGENAVFAYRGIPPYQETTNYVVKVMQQKQRYASSS